MSVAVQPSLRPTRTPTGKCPDAGECRRGKGRARIEQPHLDGPNVGLGLKSTAPASASPQPPSSSCHLCTPPFHSLRIIHSSSPVHPSATTSSPLEHHHSKILVRTTTPQRWCRQVWIWVWQIVCEWHPLESRVPLAFPLRFSFGGGGDY